MFLTKKLITAFILTLVIAVSAKAQPTKVVADKVASVVGDRIILWSDITNSIEELKRRGGNVPDNAECMILEQAIISKVLMLQAEKDSLPVSDEDVEAELEQRVRYFVSQVGTEEALVEMAGKAIY